MRKAWRDGRGMGSAGRGLEREIRPLSLREPLGREVEEVVDVWPVSFRSVCRAAVAPDCAVLLGLEEFEAGVPELVRGAVRGIGELCCGRSSEGFERHPPMVYNNWNDRTRTEREYGFTITWGKKVESAG